MRLLTRGRTADEEEMPPTDGVAFDRYRRLLRTAAPEAVEEVHAEAFAALSPRHRRLLFEALAADATAADRPADADPRTLARSATRAELRSPGFLERMLRARAAGDDCLLDAIARLVLDSVIADAVFPGLRDDRV